MRNICIYGGSFNPPHVCHVLATAWALSTLDIDELWWVPTWQHAFGKDLAPFENRLAMARAAVADFGPRVTVSDIERQVGGESRTVHTLHALRTLHPDSTFSLLIGADLLPQLERWKSWDEIRRTTELFVVGREGVGIASDSFPVMLPEVSSTDIRKAIADNDREWLHPRIPRAVLALIDRDGLYR